ncbi:tetratricopeptide repeat protein, partial [Streptomyces sp. UH6]|uniref:tetratricopeptide repeat protein n=1 Tax=Streptomyces sp. UH6 TaxID=2748379 RepID=UPI0015D4AE25
MTRNEDTSVQRDLQADASGHGRISQVAGNSYQVAGDYYEAPQPGLAVPAPTTLPPRARLVGRAEQTEQLLGLLDPSAPGESAVVVSAVSGLAGIGKTALALQAAHEAVDRGWFPGGALFLSLHGYDPDRRVEAEQALSILLRGLGVTEADLPPTHDEQRALYQAELAARAQQGKPVLVIADDAGGTGQVLPLVPGPRLHRLLITSRHTLDPVALTARRLQLDELAPAQATALIADALTLADPHDPRPEQEPDALAEIAALCGHLPLALVIAAALLTADPGQPLTALAELLNTEHTRLEALHYDDHNGHSLAVQAAFDLSYQKLPPDQARLLRLLSCNPGPDISTEAATVLNNGAPARPLLAALARSGLLTEQPVGSNRWHMHDLIRLYAHHQHQETDDNKQRRQSLASLLEYYQTTSRAAGDRLRTLPGKTVSPRFTGRAEALVWMDTERNNLLLAAAAHSSFALQAVGSLSEYLHLRRAFTDALALAQHALTAAHEVGDRLGEGMALTNLGLALQEVRRFEEAIDAHTQAAEICRELGDRHREGTALNNLGNALQEVRRFEEAIDAHTQDLEICRELGDRHGEGMALNNLGTALQEVRRFEEAIDAHTQADEIFRELGDRHREGTALNNLGLALQEVRRFEEAIDALTQDLEICRELGDRHGEGRTLNNLGNALQEVRRFEEAIDAHTQAGEIFRELGDRHGEGTALNNLGNALRKVRRFEEAIDAHTQAGEIFRELGDQHREGTALNNLGNALRKVRRFEEAIDVHTQDLEICRELGDRHREGTALNNLGNALQEVRRFEEAIDAHTQADEIFREL